MEQNLVSDEELLERINKVLNESTQEKKKKPADNRQEEPNCEKFHDVYENFEQEGEEVKQSEVKVDNQKNLVLENHYLSLQLQAEKKRAKELQSKFKLFENSFKYFERLNGQLESIKREVDEDGVDTEKEVVENLSLEAMQKIKPKNIHTAASGNISTNPPDDLPKEVSSFCEPCTDEPNNKQNLKDEVFFRDAEDFKQLELGLEIVKDKEAEGDPESEKVFITKTEKRCLEDIGNIAARTRTPLDDKHQRYFERDRRKFANSIIMPEIQEVDKSECVPPEIISKTKETPVNITSTELDGLRSYLLQLKELIARRETAWARTTERDYNQRVEITRFKNEVSHLRMLCEKRQKDVKERDQIIATKDEEIRELQKRIQGLRNAIMKLEKKDDRIIEPFETVTTETENAQIIQRSYNAMKKQSLLNRANTPTLVTTPTVKTPANVTLVKPVSKGRESTPKKTKNTDNIKKLKICESTSNDEEAKPLGEKKVKSQQKQKPRQKSEPLRKTKETFDRVDEKLQRVEEMLQNEVLKGAKRSMAQGRLNKQTDLKNLLKNHSYEKSTDFYPMKKCTPSNSTIRQEMLAAMTGINANSTVGLRPGAFNDPKKNHVTAAVIANALLAAKNANIFSY